MRDTREVIEDHLRRRLEGDVDGDIEHNYAEDVVAVSLETRGVGLDAIRGMADYLARAMPDARFEMDELIVEGRGAMEVWSGRSERGVVGRARTASSSRTAGSPCTRSTITFGKGPAASAA